MQVIAPHLSIVGRLQSLTGYPKRVCLAFRSGLQQLEHRRHNSKTNWSNILQSWTRRETFKFPISRWNNDSLCPLAFNPIHHASAIACWWSAIVYTASVHKLYLQKLWCTIQGWLNLICLRINEQLFILRRPTSPQDRLDGTKPHISLIVLLPPYSP